jgi:hypothetical protein
MEIRLPSPVCNGSFVLVLIINQKSITMKKIMYLALLLTGLSATAATPPEISEKVLKAFHQTFTGAEDVTWNETETNCQASFKISEVQVRALYDNEGNLLETVRYYGEKNLPLNVLTKLKRRYAGKEVFGVTEISSENDIAYHIVLKDDKNWYKVKADPYGNLQQTEKFKNAGE